MSRFRVTPTNADAFDVEADHVHVSGGYFWFASEPQTGNRVGAGATSGAQWSITTHCVEQATDTGWTTLDLQTRNELDGVRKEIQSAKSRAEEIQASRDAYSSGAVARDADNQDRLSRDYTRATAEVEALQAFEEKCLAKLRSAS